MEYIKYEFDTFRLFLIKTEDFKGCNIEVNFLDDYEKVDVSRRNFLANVISYTNGRYKTRRELVTMLEDLYGAGLYGDASRVGKTLFTTFGIDFLNPKYVTEKDYLENVIKLLMDSIFNPNIKDQKFDLEAVSIMKDKAHLAIDRYKEEALSYAFYDAHEKFFKDDEIFKKRIIGSHEDIDNITGENLFNEYDLMLKNSFADIVVVGNLDMNKVKSLISKYFVKNSIVKCDFDFLSPCNPKDINDYEVYGKYAQTQVLMYYVAKDLTDYERNVVSIIYNQILANANQSDKLATYLRIENPLAYYRGCKMQCRSNYMVIYTGLNYNNVKKAREMIQKAVNEMASGDFTLEYLEQQKKKIAANILMSQDNIYHIANNYYNKEIMGTYLDENLREEIMKVTKEDIVNMGKKFELKMTYVLKEAGEMNE